MNVSKWCRRLSLATVAAMSLTVGVSVNAQTKSAKQNLVQLIASSQSIIAGTVRSVSDGIDAHGIPYTEVTIAVGASPKGNIQRGDYSFRQFGLTEPRTLPNGKRMLMVTPAEFPQWRANEYVVAFLYHPAAKTGLQTTTGLAQGKLTLVNNKLSNPFANAGLFDGVQAQAGVLSADEQQLLKSRGPVEAGDLLGLIHHIVDDQLIQRGMIQ